MVKKFAQEGELLIAINLRSFAHSLRSHVLDLGRNRHEALLVEVVAALDIYHGEAAPGPNIDEAHLHLHTDEDEAYLDPFIDDAEAEIDHSLDMTTIGLGFKGHPARQAAEEGEKQIEVIIT